jgi:hypothetical protein
LQERGVLVVVAMEIMQEQAVQALQILVLAEAVEH